MHVQILGSDMILGSDPLPSNGMTQFTTALSGRIRQGVDSALTFLDALLGSPNATASDRAIIQNATQQVAAGTYKDPNTTLYWVAGGGVALIVVVLLLKRKRK